MTFIRVLVLMLVFGPAPLLAQENISLARGAPVRLAYLLPESDGWTTAEGILASAPDSDPFLIQSTGRYMLAIPAADIQSVAVRRGTRSASGTGFFFGALAGAALGAAAGPLLVDGLGCGSYSPEIGGPFGGQPFFNTDQNSDCNGWVAGALVGVLHAGSAGAGIGSKFTSESWEEVPLGLRGFSVTPDGGSHVAAWHPSFVEKAEIVMLVLVSPITMGGAWGSILRTGGSGSVLSAGWDVSIWRNVLSRTLSAKKGCLHPVPEASVVLSNAQPG